MVSDIILNNLQPVDRSVFVENQRFSLDASALDGRNVGTSPPAPRNRPNSSASSPKSATSPPGFAAWPKTSASRVTATAPPPTRLPSNPSPNPKPHNPRSTLLCCEPHISFRFRPVQHHPNLNPCLSLFCSPRGVFVVFSSAPNWEQFQK
ncbi:hypothetical protein L596_019999 [Steinernema carpocapsae]|uniref:Uncharacterized protein n=1 Tax=Steinernema carpocapsae TaxID=34508 RepID=A0A4U5MSD1_STECR|nr:hypothetical protein L596_019999 [Steinernema carpocapsae]